jgi:hypothetical protein
VCGSVRARLSATLGLAGSVSVAIVCAGGASGRTACSSLGFDSMTEGIWWWPGCDHSSATTGSSATTMRLRVCVDIPSITPMAPCRLHAPLCRGHSYKAQGSSGRGACWLRPAAACLSAVCGAYGPVAGIDYQGRHSQNIFSTVLFHTIALG